MTLPVTDAAVAIAAIAVWTLFWSKVIDIFWNVFGPTIIDILAERNGDYRDRS